MSEAYDHLRENPAVGPLIDEHGELDLEPAADPFRRLVVSVIDQQLSTASAAAIRARVRPVRGHPRGDAGRRRDRPSGAGLSTQKIEYVQNVAAAFREGRVSREAFAGVPDEAVIEELTEVRGVGVWTAKTFLF